MGTSLQKMELPQVGTIRIFRVGIGEVNELAPKAVQIEKALQSLFERNLEGLLKVRFLATEHSTGPIHRGRIDTLAIDESGRPVIIEYKRSLNDNVMSQCLFYLDWLLDHKRDFEWLVGKRLGEQTISAVDWSAPRLLCIAANFTRYDIYAVKQIRKRIELFRYQRYGDDLLLLERVHPTEEIHEPVSNFSEGAAHVSEKFDPAMEMSSRSSPLGDALEIAVPEPVPAAIIDQTTIRDRSDYERCLNHLLASAVNSERSGTKRTVSEWLGDAMSGAPKQPGIANAILETCGIKVVFERAGSGPPAPWLHVANAHPGLERLFERTCWAQFGGATAGWVQSLRRCSFSEPHGPLRFAGVAIRTTRLPANRLTPSLARRLGDRPNAVPASEARSRGD